MGSPPVRPGMLASGQSQQGMRPNMMHAPMQQQQQQQPRPMMGAQPGRPNGAVSPRPAVGNGRPIPMAGQPSGTLDPNLVHQMGNINVAASVQTGVHGAPMEGAGAAATASGRSKRSARAYHQDDAPPSMDPGSNGWNAANQGVGQGQLNQQPAWQQAAAARVAQYDQLDGNHDAALDQIPGQRNVLHPDHAAHNQAQINSQNRSPVSYAQNIAMQPGMSGPQTPGINQPPHSAGQRFPGPRSKIDPDQIPSPVEAMDNDQDFFDKEWFETCGRGGLPLSTTDFAAIDQGERESTEAEETR